MVTLTQRHQVVLQQLRDQLAAKLGKTWATLGSYDRADIDRFAEAVDTSMESSARATVSAATGYYSLLGGVRAAVPDAATVKAAVDLSGPFLAYWHALSESRPWDEAVAAGQSMAEATGAGFVQSTARRTGDYVLDGSGVVGWRRVLTARSCVWCATVATQRYRSAESADFGHNHCDCTAVPIYGDRDPGRVINRPLLDTLKAADGSPRYVDEHGAD